MSDDKQLKKLVLDALSWDPSVNAAHIGVTTNDGIVTLTGHVPSFWEKFSAARTSRLVKEVKGVADEIEVRLPPNIKHGDEEIASAALSQIKWDSAITSAGLKVTVEKGWVTLTGEVDWHYQKEAATRDVHRLWGVLGISNEITIRKKTSTSEIKNDILIALDRSNFDRSSIDVTAEGGNVKLTGTVHSWYERDEASAAAWAAVGTMAVDNRIDVM
jgi:osmotically-inducible protein OsmY